MTVPSPNVDHHGALLWDGTSRLTDLLWLVGRRVRFRASRLIERIRSPRRMLATVTMIAFLALYFIGGVVVLSRREPADPARLQLWLSGGMVIYAIYHLTKCVWSSKSEDLEFSAAEALWLAGGPFRRSSLAVYHLADVSMASLAKTALLCVALWVDLRQPLLTALALFTGLMVLETLRAIMMRCLANRSRRSLIFWRVWVTALAATVAFFVLARLAATTPAGSPAIAYVLNSFSAIGDLASSTAIQWAGLPWWCVSKLAIVSVWTWQTVLLLAGTLAVLPAAVLLLVMVDRSAIERGVRHERQRLLNIKNVKSAIDDGGVAGSRDGVPAATKTSRRWTVGHWCGIVPARIRRSHWGRQWVTIASRQAISIRRYRVEILGTLLLPALLCLSPIVLNDRHHPWLFVLGGIAMCTSLLAPPALRLDFRRDLKRMALLKSLPVAPSAMVMGQLTWPLVITIAFQWTVLIIAANLLGFSWSGAVLWPALLAAWAVFTFASENAMFLVYPHHERAQGIAVMIRTKLAFVGKAVILMTAIALLMAWAMLTRSLWSGPVQQVTFVTGAVTAAWSVAMVALWTTRRAWVRFDLTDDVPPE
ncbi:hypothetical protein [Crateriforma conspicua]|uniref:Uncharacterized protein n=1 Tax=Crateriforma conspicua TaxID=2527996 RepID=A0A5C5Y9M6_9PLAN|nr:hypothetical protein [Crateriforma conspicua]TWT72396.1 hypothetical protein Pan14r_47160 [Crateriforma conspicua]